MKFRLILPVFCIMIILPVNCIGETSNGSMIKRSIESTDFVSVWNTDLTSEGSSNTNQIALPLVSDGTYDFLVDWGDGSSDTITSYDQGELIHTYSSEGEYILVINGTLYGWQFNNAGDRLKIIEISQWGNISLGNSGSYFYGAENLQISALDAPDLTGTTTLNHMFAGTRSFNQPIEHWDVSSVTNMRYMFDGASSYNQNIGNWDVSRVTDMNRMFRSASSFNQPLGNWDVSSVTDMNGMLNEAVSFNQPIANWDVSSVTDMAGMFSAASSFNQPIGNWDVSSVTNMAHMFPFGSPFNQPIGNWDVSSVTMMDYMFIEATSFNQPLNNWDVSNVIDLSYMFGGNELSTQNYDALLNAWSKLPLQTHVIFDAGNSHYTSEASDSRSKLIDEYQWTIHDGGKVDSTTTSNFLDIFDKPTPITEITTSEEAFLYINNLLIIISLGVIAVFSCKRRRIKTK